MRLKDLKKQCLPFEVAAPDPETGEETVIIRGQMKLRYQDERHNQLVAEFDAFDPSGESSRAYRSRLLDAIEELGPPPEEGASEYVTRLLARVRGLEPRGVTAEETLEQRDRLRQIVCNRVLSWDLLDDDDNPIPLTVEALAEHQVEDEILMAVLKALNEARFPNS